MTLSPHPLSTGAAAAAAAAAAGSRSRRQPGAPAGSSSCHASNTSVPAQPWWVVGVWKESDRACGERQGAAEWGRPASRPAPLLRRACCQAPPSAPRLRNASPSHQQPLLHVLLHAAHVAQPLGRKANHGQRLLRPPRHLTPMERDLRGRARGQAWCG